MQIENEYQNVEAAFHEKGTSYVRWAAKLAVGLETGVPWKMCKQSDAPDPVVSLLLTHTKLPICFETDLRACVEARMTSKTVVAYQMCFTFLSL